MIVIMITRYIQKYS